MAAQPASRCRVLLGRGLAGVLALLIVGGLTGGLWLPLLGTWLVVSEPPTPADAIVVLGGGRGERARSGAHLYEAGLAHVLVTTGDVSGMHEMIGKSQAQLDAELAEQLGVPRAAIVALSQSTSTREDALYTLEVAQARGWGHLLVVTSPYHTRRSRMVFQQVMAPHAITLTIIAATPSDSIPDRWWTQERDLLSVTGEYLKLVYYALKGWL